MAWVPEGWRLSNSATTQVRIQGSELAQPNIYLIDELQGFELTHPNIYLNDRLLEWVQDPKLQDLHDTG